RHHGQQTRRKHGGQASKDDCLLSGAQRRWRTVKPVLGVGGDHASPPHPPAEVPSSTLSTCSGSSAELPSASTGTASNCRSTPPTTGASAASSAPSATGGANATRGYSSPYVAGWNARP